MMLDLPEVFTLVFAERDVAWGVAGFGGIERWRPAGGGRFLLAF